MSLDLCNARPTNEKLFHCFPIFINSYGEKLVELSNHDIAHFEYLGVDFEEFKRDYAEGVKVYPFGIWLNLGYNI